MFNNQIYKTSAAEWNSLMLTNLKINIIYGNKSTLYNLKKKKKILTVFFKYCFPLESHVLTIVYENAVYYQKS